MCGKVRSGLRLLMAWLSFGFASPDRSALVDTCWDLGSPINTCVWFFQAAAGEIRVIDIDMDLDLTPVERVARMLAKLVLASGKTHTKDHSITTV